MGMPEIPDFDINREDAINLILASIAFEELALAHIMNAEGEKLQRVIEDEDATMEDIMEVNEQVTASLRAVIKKEMLLQFKLEDTIGLIEEEDDDEA
ncbi:hypothetical protein B0H94_11457 [Salsuginibacillus halophilus]|uniref:Uncharacterized protein n=1 Tax=Salsuginibacillus halophilus TaxID=517424 RepID=A0A2P8H8M7_9BACI|nr:hypothetical protein [Salsuginibacillus halophilus]PSL42583.1 hypothetical protein B0H94_11457 [Salsuginibacillus halophilus]